MDPKADSSEQQATTDKSISIVKRSGERAKFNETKLRESLERSGAGIVVLDEIVAEIRTILHEGLSTKAIYKKAFQLLKRKSRSSAARYKLKRAIFELGPTGYPFERFVGELLKHQGYDVKVGAYVQGHCVQHEVDVVASRDNRKFMIECKFHSDYHRKCGVQVPLYIQSRFEDIKRKWLQEKGGNNKFHQGWIVTNTRFSEDAIEYGTCMGLRLISWDYPQKGSLKERIDTSGLHPITCLSALTKSEKQRLLDLGIVLCGQLRENPAMYEKALIDRKKVKKIEREIDDLFHEMSSR